MSLLLVMLGSALGGGARYLAELAWPYDPSADEIPMAIVAVNVLGSLLAGIYLGLTSTNVPLATAQPSLLVVTGILGGFTTFSAFSLHTVQMLADGEPYLALAYVGLTVVGTVAAAGLGFLLAQA
jgi:CrcB protein